MSHKVITMSDSNYFKFGKLFLDTRYKINADFILYSHNLTFDQQKLLHKRDIKYETMSYDDFEKRMMYFKFALMAKECLNNKFSQNLITFVDFDTLFINDWNEKVNSYDFDLGITIRNDEIIKQRHMRAQANGGVIFGKTNIETRRICHIAMELIKAGKSKYLPEYNSIWTKELEDKNRPDHKRHQRTAHRCWVDQVFLSALVIRLIPQLVVSHYCERIWRDYTIGFFNCDMYNKLTDDFKYEKDVYIKHLKEQGRKHFGKDAKLLEKKI